MAGSFRATPSGIVMLIRLFCIESYRTPTDWTANGRRSYNEGDYILVNKIRRGRITPLGQGRAFYQSALSRFSGCSLIHQPLHRYAGRYDPGQHGRIYDKRADKSPFSPLPQFLFHNTERQGDVLGDVREVGHPTEGFQAGKFWLHAQPHGFRGISIEGGIARCHKPSFYRGTNARIHVDPSPGKTGLTRWTQPRSPPARRSSCGRRMARLPSATESYIWTGGRLISSFSDKTTIGYCPIIPTRR